MGLEKRLYGEIAKVEEQDDGTIKVYGYASSEAVDSDGEVIKADAMQAAITDYMKFPAVREMHQPIAAGTGIVMKVEDDGRTWFGAHVVDPVAVKKVVTKVYRGFSIGAKVTGRDEANKAVITGIKLKEVSLVDRPANPEAVIELWKADIEPEEAVDEIAKLLTEKTIEPSILLDLAKAHLSKPEEKPEVGTQPPVVETKPEESETKAEKSDTDTDVKKSLWDVREFAACLQSIAYLCESAESEKQWEGDNSPLPASMRDWLTTGVGLFQAMSQEESSEMLARLQGMVKADTRTDIEKAGARFSKATKGTLATVHKMLRDCDKALTDMGYETADEDEADGGKADTKVDKTAAQKVEPAPAPQPAAPSVEAVEKMVGDLGSQLKQLVDKVTKLEAEPAAPKGKLIAVEKSDEVTLGQPVDPLVDFNVIKKSDGSVDTTASMIKLVHRQGGVRLGSQ